MDKKEFLKITKDILMTYGFKKIKKHYYLVLPEAIIKLQVEHNRFSNEELCFSMVLSIKALSSDPDEICFSAENTHILNAPYLFSNPKLFKIVVSDDSNISKEILKKGNSYFNPSNYIADEWINIFNEMLHRYFDPFKKDVFSAIKEANKVRNNNLFFALKKDVAEFIGVENY